MIKLTRAMNVWWAAQDIRFKDNTGKFEGASSGIVKMDAIDKLRHPFYAAVIAKNKAGKTALMLTLALAYAKQGFVVLMDCLEMNLYQICTRIAANASNTDMNQYEHIKAGLKDWQDTLAAIQELSNYDFYITEGKDTKKSLQTEIDKVKALHPDRKILVVVDYGQLMVGDEDESDYKVQTGLSKWFKRMTLDRNYNEETITPEQMLGLTGDCFSILTASQIIISAKRSGEKITDASTLNGGSIGNDCDVWLVLNDVTTEDGVVIPNCRRITMGGRFTRGGEFDITFDGAKALFQDYDPDFIASAI